MKRFEDKVYEKMQGRFCQWNAEKKYRCVFCGQELAWSSCANANELIDEYGDDDTAIVWYFRCSTCGCDYEIIEPNEEERETIYKEYYQ